jgi:hypothetical protein
LIYIFRYAVLNFSDIVKTEAWQTLIQSHPRLAKKVFEEAAP